jgi:peptide/nickel transport system permease protein
MSLAEVEATTESAQVGEEGGTLPREAWRRLRRDPVALVGFGLIAFFILVAIFAPLIAPYGPADNPGAGTVTPTTIPGPSTEHWFGLDELGRDEYSRVLYGARQSLLVGVVATALGMIGGLTLGVIAGAFGGKVC